MASAHRLARLAVLWFVLAQASMAQANVTTVSYWRGGENDPGGVSGSPSSSTLDLIGGRTLQFSTPVFWDLFTGASAAARTGSRLGLRAYGGDSAGTGPVIPSLTDHFGLELWVNPITLTGNQCLAYNGNSASNGWGLYLLGNQYRALFGGVAFVGTATATAGTWTHLALVRVNGTATFYVNGVAAGTEGRAPVAPAGQFAIMGQAQNPSQERLNGALDEVRVFTFAPGAFSVNDLLWNLGKVTTTAVAGSGSLRQLITDLNGLGVPGNITFSVNGTITLASDLPAFTRSVTITGPGTNLLTISGGNAFRLLRLAADTTNSISGLTLANGRAANDHSGAALYFGNGSLTATNCTFTSGSDVDGPISNTGVNLTSGNPVLAPGGNYGGPTQTMPLLPSSPAIDGATSGTSFTTDQRGKPRLLGAFADLGAVEGVFDPAFSSLNLTQPGPGSVKLAFTNLSGPGYRVLASPDLATPINAWSNLGAPVESPAGSFTFTDPGVADLPRRFYRIVTP